MVESTIIMNYRPTHDKKFSFSTEVDVMVASKWPNPLLSASALSNSEPPKLNIWVGKPRLSSSYETLRGVLFML